MLGKSGGITPPSGLSPALDRSRSTILRDLFPFVNSVCKIASIPGFCVAAPLRTRYPQFVAIRKGPLSSALRPSVREIWAFFDKAADWETIEVDSGRSAA
jgi:hypothetical protein